MHFELIVVGGGFSGVAAALTAARNGVQTLIIEKSNCFGGAAVNALVNPFMPNDTTIDKKPTELSQGLYTEIRSKLAHHADTRTFDEEHLKLVLNRLLVEAGVTILFRSYLTAAEMDGQTIKAIDVANIAGVQRYTADRYIDATGDAQLAYLCGCPTQVGRERDGLCQPMTMCFRIANVEIDRFVKAAPAMQVLYKQWYAEGRFLNVRDDVLWFPNCVSGVIHLNSTRIVKHDPTDPMAVSRAEIAVREQVHELHAFLQQNVDGCQHCQIVATGMEIGVRESRKIQGRYILTGADLVACQKFDDAIAAGNYDIDIHNPEGGGTSHYYFKDGEFYTIPYRCLQPLNARNLLVAGRSISATHEAQASIRIMPICCTLGEAAGMAASLAKSAGVDYSEVDVHTLQTKLIAAGAFLYAPLP